MADFAAARPAHKPNLANAERRKVIVQHEALERFAGLQQLDALFIVLGAQRDRHQRLRFAARKERGTVRARQNARFTPDRRGLRRKRGHRDGGAASSISSRKTRSLRA